MEANKARHSVLIYHDESDDVADRAYRAHVLLFVPCSLSVTHEPNLFGDVTEEWCPRDILMRRVNRLRSDYRITRKKLHFASIGGRRWTNYDTGVRLINESLVDALKHRRPNVFTRCLCCRLAIMFYPRGADLSDYGGGASKERRMRHRETVLRILLKGGLHYLYGDSHTVNVLGLVSDGEPDHRPMDPDRIIGQILLDGELGRTSLRDYATFAEDAAIVHLPSDHKLHTPGSQAHVHANMLQLADLALGSTIRSCYVGCEEHPDMPRHGAEVKSKKDVVAHPVKEMLAKIKRGRGFRSSGHYGAFSVSALTFEGPRPSFSRVSPVKVRLTDENLELPLA